MLLQTRQSYNTNNQLAGQSWLLTNADESVTTYSESYSYNSTDGSLATFMPAVGSQLSFTYDGLRRLDTVTGGRYTKSYDYRDLSEANRTTAQVSSLSYSGFTNAPSYGYVYDALGYITSYTENGTTYGYTYDEQGQLVAASGYDQSYTYEYDSVGNITKRTQGTTEHSYSYDNTVWLDLLTKYDGQYIQYEGQQLSGSTVTGTPTTGNPISYYNGTRWTFDWEEGRNLVSADSTGASVDYVYDQNGLRVSKTVDGVKHTYLYASGKLLRESYGNVVLDFFYDQSGYPYAMTYKNGTAAAVTYYYITNLQGDVLTMITGTGTSVASYTYDPYGKPLTATGTMATINPLRYRGYYYDTETGFYYLQSRYYDPTICRFINADSYASTGQGVLGNNMFAYCGNNTIVYADDSGTVRTVTWGTEESMLTQPWKDSGGIRISSSELITYSGPEDPWITVIILDYIFNDDPQTVLEAKHFAFYKGQLVIKHDWAFTNGRSGSFIFMFLHEDDKDARTIQHEWGHYVQLSQMGIIAYAFNVAIPSVTSDARDPFYNSNPWERTADFWGGVSRTEGYRCGSLAWGFSQYILGPLSVPLYYMFGK